MADYNSLKATIDANIRANGVQAITGPVLNACLKAMITVLGNGYQLQGSIAQPGDDPSVPDARVAYVASGPGTYTDFGGLVIPDDGHAYMLTWDTQWTAVQLPVPTSAALSALATVVAGKQDILTFDPAPVSGSLNPVTSGGIFSAIEHAKGAAGLAEALLDTDSEGTEQEFSLRKSGGDGGAYFRRLLGNTKAFNQLVQNGNFASGTTGWNVVAGAQMSVADNVLTVGGFEAAPAAAAYISRGCPFVVGHKYIFAADVLSNEATHIRVLRSQYGADFATTIAVSANTKTRVCVLGQVSTVPSNDFVLYFNTSAELSAAAEIKISNIYGIDLTAMQDNSTTPEEFREKYPLLYYAYGRKLIHCKVAKVITKGANQWDEVAEDGGYNATTGAKISVQDIFRSKNFIPVFSGAEYYINGKPSAASTFIRLFYYDADKNFISASSFIKSGTFTTPANCRFMTFQVATNYYGSQTYQNDICINLSDAEINGQYFPYWERELALDITNQEDTDGNKPFAEGMMGAGSAADYANEVGGAKVMGKLDLGTLDWTIGTQGGFIRVTSSEIPEEMKTNQNFVPVNSINAYGFVPSASPLGVNTTNMGMACYNNRLYIRNDAWENKTEEQIKTELSGVILVYEKATPVPFTWKEPLNTGIKVSKYGTEEITPAQTENIDNAPFRAVATYSISVANLVAALSALGNRGGAKGSLGSGNQEENPENEELIPEEESPKEEAPKEEETPVVEPEVQSKK